MSRPHVTRRRPRLAAALLGAVVAATLAGCTGSGGAEGDGSAGQRALGAVADESAADGAFDQGDFGTFRPRGGSTSSGPTAAQVTLLSRDLIQRATLTVRARDVGGALVRVRTIVEGVQGVLADEHTVTNRRGEPRHSTLTLRVPADAFATVLDDLSGLGRAVSQQVSTEDVSTELVDVEARIISAERTIKRVRELLDAADDFSDILSLEGELARREADLASLTAQQDYLEDQTSLSTIQLTLLPPLTPQPPAEDEPAGFVAGLHVGWDALVGLVTVLLTALGVLLPLLVVLLPAGALAWWGLRRAVRRPPAPQPTE
ncbi:MAG: DUF4349 domain-containing protein [Actinomycetota bacterium]|nr:DUF4349 domain-containing protein [Actinomycetota bacterium]